MAALATSARSMAWTQIGYLVTGLLGLGFLILEGNEFAQDAGGRAPGRSAAPFCPPFSPSSACTGCM